MTNSEPTGGPTLSRPSAVLWDMDGTLLDSEPIWDVAIEHFALRLGIVLSPALRESTFGNSMPDAMSKLYDAADTPSTSRDAARDSRWLIDHVAELFRAGLPWRPGARAALQLIQAADIPMALVTNTERELAEVALDTIGRGNFTTTVCGDEVPSGKPAPDPYLRAAELLGHRPDRCLAVEDSPTGARAATAAGCPTLVVPSAAPVPHGALRSFRPTLVGLSIQDIEDAFGGSLTRPS